MRLTPQPLTGRFTRLEPFVQAHREPVREAISGDDPVWDIMASNASGEHFDGWWDRALTDMRSGQRVAFAVRRLSDARITGVTSFLHIDPANRSLEIGATLLSPDVRSGVVNPDMKFSMLAHAFEHGALRVEIRTDGRNLRSQAAIARLGAVREGVLRKQKILWTGVARETVVFSIIDEDWPQVRAGLEARLATLAPI